MKILITGGAGFIGCNSVDYFIEKGHDIVIFDNLSRQGGDSNIRWLRQRHGDKFELIVGDIRDFDALCAAMPGVEAVIHLAGQVAVTTSVVNPREDFEINALGTFNVLEATRLHAPKAAFLYASTNKVYGGMEEIEIVLDGDRYAYADYPQGIPETAPLDFHSPYGCSKGAGDQYVVDYARIYGMRTLVFRQSCIYGRRQFGVEDQGWVAHFIIAAVMGKPITIFGDGKQVRDMLHISDVVRAYELGIQNIDALSGTALNLGGGAANTLSIWSEFGDMLEEMNGDGVTVDWGDWRPGDQKVFVADISRAAALMGWKPTVSPVGGVQDLYRWVSANRGLFG